MPCSSGLLVWGLTATTFNAAGFSKSAHEVRGKEFIHEHGRQQDFLLLQEATYGRGDGILVHAKNAGMEVITCVGGPVIAYDSNRFSPRGTLKKLKIPAESGTCLGIGQQFEDLRTGMRVNVICVHAGHNTTDDSMKKAERAVRALQRCWSSGDETWSDIDDDGTISITGGDFNELSCHAFNFVGKGCSSRQTHKMGANEMVGARGKYVFTAESEAIGDFGSDHTAVQLTIKGMMQRVVNASGERVTQLLCQDSPAIIAARTSQKQPESADGDELKAGESKRHNHKPEAPASSGETHSPSMRHWPLVLGASVSHSQEVLYERDLASYSAGISRRLAEEEKFEAEVAAYRLCVRASKRNHVGSGLVGPGF